MLLHFHIRRPHRRSFGFWLPLFLVWVLLLVIVLPLVPLLLLAALILWPTGWGKPLLLIGPAIIRCICALRSLEIDIEKPSERLLITFR
jgi:hypothetical protein